MIGTMAPSVPSAKGPAKRITDNCLLTIPPAERYNSSMTDQSGHCYVVTQPHSLTNDSDSYRVIHSRDYMNFVNGATTSLPYSSYDSYEEAEKNRDEMNAALGSA